MSADALPISSARFAKALQDLPISSLHAKASELHNSLAHLRRSNQELEDYVRQGEDKECYEALVENKEVMRRMEERIELVRKEVVEVRGVPFEPEQKPVQRDAAPDERIDVSAETQTRQNGTTTTTEQEEGGVFL